MKFSVLKFEGKKHHQDLAEEHHSKLEFDPWHSNLFPMRVKSSQMTGKPVRASNILYLNPSPTLMQLGVCVCVWLVKCTFKLVDGETL